MKLQECSPNETYIVESMDLPVVLERRLGSLGLLEGSDITVLRKKKHGAMIVTVRGTRFAMGYAIATHIEVVKGSDHRAA